MASSQREPKKQRSKYYSKYLESFHDEWECIRKSRKSDFHAYCGICNADVSVKSGGRNDVCILSCSSFHCDNNAMFILVLLSNPFSSYF